jgi:hypothetical protein
MAASGTSWVLVMRNDAIPCSFSLFPVGGTMARYFEFLSQFFGFHLTNLTYNLLLMKIIYFPNGMNSKDAVFLLHSYIWGIMFYSVLILFFLYSGKRKFSRIATYVLFEDISINDVRFQIYKFMVSSFACSSAVNMKAICFSETLAKFRQTTRRCIPEDRTFYLCSWWKVQSHKVTTGTIAFIQIVMKLGQIMFTILVQNGKRCLTAWWQLSELCPEFLQRQVSSRQIYESELSLGGFSSSRQGL